jgi:four helix bundle protein
MALRIYGVTIGMLRELRPVMERIGAKDANLEDQIRRAATSVPLNLHEGAYSQGRNERARWHTALGSAAEVRAWRFDGARCIRVLAVQENWMTSSTN